MIENICSNVAGKEKEYPVSGRKPPKNVRQIGTFTGDFRIYVEDYVHTFTHWLAEQNHSECVAVLVGEFAKSEHAREVYAYGTVTAKQACVNGKIEMNAQVWTQVYETIKRYFPDGEIVGWFCGGTSFTAEEKEELWKIHLDHFAGADRILLLYDFLDQEEEFYRYEEGEMKCQEGYYIYYEKNTEMQNYMIEQKQGRSNEENVDDRAVREVRARWNVEKKQEAEGEGEKKDESVPKKGGGRFLYSAGIVMTAVALIAAASLLYNQERLKGFEQTLNKLLGSGEEKEMEAKEVSGKTGNKKENDRENSEKNETMVWEITASAAPEKKEEGDDSLSDMEREPNILDGTSDVTGEEKGDEDSKKDVLDEGKETKEDVNGEESVNQGQEKGDGRQENDNLSESAQTGKETDKDELENQEQEKGEKEELDDGKLEKENPSGEKEDQNEGEQATPKPGDAVQTGEIGGPGVAVDTSKMQIYTVKSGDTLVGICKKFYGNLEQLEYIKELNQINNENLIYVDQELVLP